MFEMVLVFLFWFFIFSGLFSIILMIKKILDFHSSDELQKTVMLESLTISMIICLAISLIQFISSFTTINFLTHVITPGTSPTLSMGYNGPRIPSFIVYCFILSIVFSIREFQLGLLSKRKVIISSVVFVIFSFILVYYSFI